MDIIKFLTDKNTVDSANTESLVYCLKDMFIELLTFETEQGRMKWEESETESEAPPFTQYVLRINTEYGQIDFTIKPSDEMGEGWRNGECYALTISYGGKERCHWAAWSSFGSESENSLRKLYYAASDAWRQYVRSHIIFDKMVSSVIETFCCSVIAEQSEPSGE